MLTMALPRRGGHQPGLGRFHGPDHGAIGSSSASSISGNAQQDRAITSSRNASGTNKRRTLGGRGREWAHFAHKLLESMLELDDSKPFRDQVDPLKYPNYYIIVTHPMDLSQVMMKLHRGSYDSLVDFGSDIRLIFNNWKLYVTDSASPLYSTVCRLSWWFDQEFSQIQKEWDLNRCKRQRLNRELEQIDNTHSHKDNLPTSIPLVRVSAGGHAGMTSTHVTPPSSISSSIPTHHLLVTSSSASSNISSSSLLGKHNTLPQVLPMHGVKARPQEKTKLIMSIRHGMCSLVQQNGKDKPGSPVSGSRHNQTVSTPVPVQSRAMTVPTTSSSSSKAASTHRKEARAGGESEGPDAQTMDSFKLEMEMEVTNIWFGPCRTKPLQKVHLSEDGIKMRLKGAKNDISFSMKAAEIVRAVGHLSRSRKHTLFLFVTPACEKRLRELSSTHQVFGAKPKGDPCSLVAIFIKSLLPVQISTMVHIFWNMSKSSLFGQLFSEVDQKGALTILANIKPQIMEKIAEKVKEPEQNLPVQTLSDAPSRENYHKNGANLVTPTSVPSRTITPSLAPSSTIPRPALPDMPMLVESRSTVPNEINSSLSQSTNLTDHRGPRSEHRSRSYSHSKDPSNSPTSHSEMPCAETVSPWVAQSSSSTRTFSDAQNSGNLSQSINKPDLQPHSSPLFPSLEGRSIPESQVNGDLTAVTTESAPLSPTRLTDFLHHPTPGRPVGNSHEVVLSPASAQDSKEDADSDGEDEGSEPDDKSQHSPTEVESDLEIIIPSDSEDEMVTNSLEDAGDDEMVMTRQTINTKCPIIQCVMKCPMKNKICGHNYDRDGVQQLIINRHEKARCPVPGCSNITPLSMKDMTFDYEMIRIIQNKQKENTGSFIPKA